MKLFARTERALPSSHEHSDTSHSTHLPRKNKDSFKLNKFQYLFSHQDRPLSQGFSGSLLGERFIRHREERFTLQPTSISRMETPDEDSFALLSPTNNKFKRFLTPLRSKPQHELQQMRPTPKRFSAQQTEKFEPQPSHSTARPTTTGATQRTTSFQAYRLNTLKSQEGAREIKNETMPSVMSTYYPKTATIPSSVKKHSIQESRGIQNFQTDPLTPNGSIPPVISPVSQVLSTFEGGWIEKKKPVQSNKFNYFFNTFKNMQAIDGIDLGEFEPLTAKPKVVKKVEKPVSNLIKAAEIYKSGKFKAKHKETRWPQQFTVIKTLKGKQATRNGKDPVPALFSASSQKKRSSVSTQTSKVNEKSLLGLYSCRASQETELKLMTKLEQKPTLMVRLGKEKRQVTPLNKKVVGMSGRRAVQSQFQQQLFKNTTPIKSRLALKSHSPKGSSGSPPKQKEVTRESIEHWQKFRINQNVERVEEERPTTSIDPKRAALMNKIGTTRRQQLTHHIQQRRKQDEIRKAALQDEMPSVEQSLELKIGGERQPLHLRIKSPKGYERPQNDDLYPSQKLVHQQEFGEYFLSGIMGKDMLEPHKLEPHSPTTIEEESEIKKRKNSKDRVKKRRGSFATVTTPGEGTSQKRDISTARGTTRDNSNKRDSGTKETTSKLAMKVGFNYKNDILTGPVGEEQALDMISGWN